MAIRTTISAVLMAGAMCCSANAQTAKSDPLPRAKPEDVGLSSERLADIAKTLNADIARGQIPGAVLAVARHGKLASRRRPSSTRCRRHAKSPSRTCSVTPTD
jgi:hypothetical protein